MKTLGWLLIAAVMFIGGLVEYGGPVRRRAPAGQPAVPAVADRGERPAAQPGDLAAGGRCR